MKSWEQIVKFGEGAKCIDVQRLISTLQPPHTLYIYKYQFVYFFKYTFMNLFFGTQLTFAALDRAGYG